MGKVRDTLEAAIHDIRNGATVAVGGFFVAGVPRLLLKALIGKKVKDLTLAGESGPFLGAKDKINVLVEQGQIGKASQFTRQRVGAITKSL
jgi:acyl CoA:acetate/3-ketoacid CoA transferase alpha subunit